MAKNAKKPAKPQKEKEQIPTAKPASENKTSDVDYGDTKKAAALPQLRKLLKFQGVKK